MLYLIYGFLAIQMIAYIIFIWLAMKRHQKTIHHQVIKQPNIYLVGGFFIVSVGLFLSSLIGLSEVMDVEDQMTGMIIFMLYFMSGYLILWIYLRWMIIVETSSFIYHPTFGKKRSFRFEDVSYYPKSAHKIIYANDGYAIKIPYMCNNIAKLTDQLKIIDPKKQLEQSQKTYQLRYNVFSKSIAFVMFILGLSLMIMIMIAIIYDREEMLIESNDIVSTSIALVFGLIATITGFLGLCLTFFWKISFNKDQIIVDSPFRKKRIYNIKDISFTFTKHGYHLHINQNQKIYVNEGLVDHTFLIHVLKLCSKS